MSNIFVKLMVPVLFILCAGCNSQKSFKVGLLIHQMEGRWFTDVEHLKEQADLAGLELSIKSAKGNENLQLSQGRELLNEDVDALIVVAVNQNTAGAIVRMAHEFKVPVIAYDRLIENANLDFYVSYDYTEIGRMQANYAVSKVSSGNYVLLWGDASDNNAQLMRRGHEEVLSAFVEAGKINVVYKAYIEGWNEDNAFQKMITIGSFSDEPIDVVIASNDNIARAVVSAYQELGIRKPQIITGQDATEESMLSIRLDGQSMTISKPTEEMASKAMNLVVNVLQKEKINIDGYVNNKRIDVPTVFLTNAYVVDQSNMGVTAMLD